MREIIVNSKKHGIKKIFVSDVDFKAVSKYKWYVFKTNSSLVFYAVTNILTSKGKRIMYMHRFLMEPDNKEEIDHRDSNGLNNTRRNLRKCTRLENGKNIRRNKVNKTGYKGVSFEKRFNKYVARIMVNRKEIRIGMFDNPIDAAIAYNRYAIRLHKEFANINKL